MTLRECPERYMKGLLSENAFEVSKGGFFVCMMLFLASDKRLPTIPWDNCAKQNIMVSELDERDNLVIKHFTKKFIYDIGAFEGCGCGFQFGIIESEDEEDRVAEASGRESVEELFHYLREHINSGEIAEVYSCWAGDEGCNTEHRTLINLREFKLGDKFQFLQNQLVIIQG
jgi:hypothetical protein